MCVEQAKSYEIKACSSFFFKIFKKMVTSMLRKQCALFLLKEHHDANRPFLYTLARSDEGGAIIFFSCCKSHEVKAYRHFDLLKKASCFMEKRASQKREAHAKGHGQFLGEKCRRKNDAKKGEPQQPMEKADPKNLYK